MVFISLRTKKFNRKLVASPPQGDYTTRLQLLTELRSDHRETAKRILRCIPLYTEYTIIIEHISLFTIRTESQYCVAKATCDSSQDFGDISFVFVPASESSGGERLAIRLAPCQFKRGQARRPT